MQVGGCSELMDADGREGNVVRSSYEALGNTSEVRQRDDIVGGHFDNFGNVAATPADDIDMLPNTVARSLTCQGNTPVPHHEGNTESGGGGANDQCPPA